jgi:hypothetical protein
MYERPEPERRQIVLGVENLLKLHPPLPATALKRSALACPQHWETVYR